ncbi:hypothetical protein JD292_03205 [Leucobacter sp. CSA2]|uniref:YCII-related domain-containing protein n=1 Tax=Leucobacter edaphi TaxID=2796472 RepID=A0A934QDA4_9MICO|nr:YciI family protein [Leucobacter edaphi]MBK0421089.1 hypothetical protein [Leucobacter edaphi]
MPKYAMLKHYRGAPPMANDGPRTAEEWEAHVAHMNELMDRLRATGEFVSTTALAEAASWVRFDGPGRPPRELGPVAEEKALTAGWLVVDVASRDRALEIAAELSAGPGADGLPDGEWLEFRQVLD